MVVRARPIRWELLLNPTLAGLEMESQASANLGRSIAGAGESIGAGFVRSRAEKESKRRFDITSAREGEELSLRRKTHEDALLEKQRDRQSADTSILDSLSSTSELVTNEGATTGQVSPGTIEAFTQLTQAAGGPDIAQRRLAERQALFGPEQNATGADVKRIRGEADLTRWQGASDRSQMDAPPGSQRDAAMGSYLSKIPNALDKPGFDAWYAERAKRLGLDANPDAPEHHYDYRAAYRAGAEPDASGHWPSRFKDDGHPNLVVGGVNTKTGKPVGTPGEAGVVDLPSADLGRLADESDFRVKRAELEIKSVRASLDHNSLASRDVKEKARLRIKQLETEVLDASAKHSGYSRRAAQAVDREKIAHRATDATAALDNEALLNPALQSMSPEQRKAIIDSASRGTGDVVTDVSSLLGRAFPREGTDERATRHNVNRGLIHITEEARKRGLGDLTPAQQQQASDLLAAGGTPEDVTGLMLGDEDPVAKAERTATEESAKEKALRAVGLSTPRTERERAESDRVFKADEEKLREALAAARGAEADAESDVKAAEYSFDPNDKKGLPALREARTKARTATKAAADKLQGHLRGAKKEDGAAAAEAEFNNLPADQQTPENYRDINERHGVR